MDPSDATVPAILRKRGYDMRVQVTWIAPQQAVDAAVGVNVKPSPRSNLVASIEPVTHATPDAALDQFLAEVRSVVPGLEEKQRWSDQEFADGTTGAGVEVEFPATADVRLRQTHLLRIDGDVLTRLVVTVDTEVGAEEDVLLDAARRFDPTAPIGLSAEPPPGT